MQILALAAMAVLLVVWNVVGVKIMLVARRTRSFSELSLGLGLFLLAGIGVPISALGGALAPESVQQEIAIAASVPTALGIVLLFAFTAHVFHRDQRWAQVAMGVVVACGVYYVVGHGLARLAVETPVEAAVVQMAWAPFTILGALLAFAWAGAASFAYLRRLRRQEALGLADPVVVNRVLLWSLFGGISVVTTVVVAVIFYTGGVFAREIVQPLTTAAGGLADSVVLLLAFAPPRWYLESVRARARSGAAEAAAG